MDLLKQSKLTKEEWCSIEKTVSIKEKRILELIRDGYDDVNYKVNYTLNMFRFTKLENTPEMEFFIFDKYFKPLIQEMAKKYDLSELTDFLVDRTDKKIKKMKSVDVIRIQNIDAKIQDQKKNIYEFTLLEFCKTICSKLSKKKMDFTLHLYTLIQWKKNTIPCTIRDVQRFVDLVISMAEKKMSNMYIVSQAVQVIEQNPYLFQYEDLKLFSHQKELYTLCKIHRNEPKLILYIAPTGTGKTMSPIGLIKQYRVLFVCVARHIGLALAKSAIAIQKKVAFAFGCHTASDIRLHYYAAVDYEINKRTGGIGKVDNSNGCQVELMICDVQSYLCAMYYMLSFNSKEDIITYWDEPTISLDYETHELHPIIHRNWSENKIPNMVLSCATLPQEEEIQDVLQDFRMTFPNTIIKMVTSHDCRKSIPIIKKNGFCYLPHTSCSNHRDIQTMSQFCEKNKTLLRYFDLSEIITFIGFLHVFEPDDEDDVPSKVFPPEYHMNQYFQSIADITMDGLKIYYLKLLLHVNAIYWPEMYEQMRDIQKPRYKTKINSFFHRTYSVDTFHKKPDTVLVKSFSESNIPEITHEGILLTTKDAHTLTDGPTIYLIENATELSNFYVKNSHLSESLLKEIMEMIHSNELLVSQIALLELELDSKTKKKDNTDKTQDRKTEKIKMKPIHLDSEDESVEVLQYNIRQLQSNIKMISLDSKYIPNTVDHQEIWAPEINRKSFTPRIDSTVVKKIMNLNIHHTFKILTLMGIGVLVKHENTDYEEIVKQLAQEQHLFIILTTSDYIYGTNYQFCHGFIGEDLQKMTPQKTLQCMGRIGRNSIQQDYSVRFRDDAFIHSLFRPLEMNLEAVNMNKLFCHD